MKKLLKGEALMLRTCRPDGISYNDFKWPKSGPVKCKDWEPTPQCGNGLHGLLWGEGDGSLLNWSEDAAWLVVRVKESQVISIGGDKVKVPAGVVEFFGDAKAAVELIQKYAPAGACVVSGTATAGVSGTATAGYSGTATAGVSGTATAGDSGTATAGYRGTATAGYRGTATAGDSGTATAGYSGTATAGDSGTATAGVRGTATAGDSGTATAGYSGTATAGMDGVISIMYWNGEKYKRAIFVVGENGIEPNQPYQVDSAGKPIKVERKP